MIKKCFNTNTFKHLVTNFVFVHLQSYLIDNKLTKTTHKSPPLSCTFYTVWICIRANSH